MSKNISEKKYCQLRNIEVNIMRLFRPGQMSDSGAIYSKCMNQIDGVCDKLGCKFTSKGDVEPFEQ